MSTGAIQIGDGWFGDRCHAVSGDFRYIHSPDQLTCVPQVSQRNTPGNHREHMTPSEHRIRMTIQIPRWLWHNEVMGHSTVTIRSIDQQHRKQLWHNEYHRLRWLNVTIVTVHRLRWTLFRWCDHRVRWTRWHKWHNDNSDGDAQNS